MDLLKKGAILSIWVDLFSEGHQTQESKWEVTQVAFYVKNRGNSTQFIKSPWYIAVI